METDLPKVTPEEMQKRSVSARWEKLTKEEKSQHMRTLRLKKASRRQYIVTVVQDHHGNQTDPFTVSLRKLGHPTAYVEHGRDLFRLLNTAAGEISAREETATGS